MSVKATPFQRKLIVYFLLVLAVTGAAIRLWAPNPSALRDIGSLLLVLWLPVIGNVVGFFGRKIPLPVPKLAFDATTPFSAELLVEFTPLQPQPPRPEGPEPTEGLFTLVQGREGFNARAQAPPDDYLASAGPQQIALQFLHPARAMARFPVGTPFKVLVGIRSVGRGTVLQAPMTPPIAGV
ncbi:MAG: hypothetical protein ABIT82_09745 [Ramlibacter sp.]